MAYQRDYKECLYCQKSFLPLTSVHRFCSESCKGHYKYVDKTVTTEKQYHKISGNWKKYLQRLLYCNGRKRDSLTVESLLEILEKQDYKCALSGVELTCQLEVGKDFLTNASVDRIEAGGPYIKENIQLVCKVLNKFRVNTDLEEFIWWCKKVAEHNDLR